MKLAGIGPLVAMAPITLHATALHAAQIVTVEPDDYGRGAEISQAVPGVTLFVEGRVGGPSSACLDSSKRK